MRKTGHGRFCFIELERPSRGFGIFFFCTSETSREEAGAERVVPDPLQHEDAMFLQWRVL
jgi:hypothetical protein